MSVDTHEEDRQMPTPGQPKLYNPAYCEFAPDYCLVGATNEVLADYFGVTRRTIPNWIATHPDFADAVRKGRIVADAKVVHALFERATGFSGKVTRTTRYRGEKHTITTTVSYPPDTQACMFWLRNRQPEYWEATPAPPPELEMVDDDLAAMLDAAGEGMRHGDLWDETTK
jgi:hypothetical protein